MDKRRRERASHAVRDVVGGVNVARSIETGAVLGALTVVLAVTGLLLSPTVASVGRGWLYEIQAAAGSTLYVIHMASAALLVAFTIWHLLPFRRAFNPRHSKSSGSFATAHMLHAFVVVQVVTGYALWIQWYDMIPKATAAKVHLVVTFLLLAPLAPHAWRGWHTWRERTRAQAAALVAADVRGKGATARAAREGASRRAFLRVATYAAAGAALAWTFGRTVANNVRDWRLNSVGATPHLTKDSWRLSITGLVDKSIELTYADILNMPQVTRTMTHHCVEGWTYTDTFVGVRLSDVLVKAGVKPEGRMLIFHSPERSRHPLAFGTPYTTNFAYREDILPDIFLVHKAGGKDLPAEHGFPVRIITERKWGYKACKWLTEIEVSSDERYQGYWERFGYHNVGDYPGPIFA